MARKAALTALVVFLSFTGTKAAFAHAILLSSAPADGAILHHRNIEITLDYNSRIDAGRCTITLRNTADRNVPLRMQASRTPSELKAAADNLTNGTYYIHWQVLASDGHITRGEISFTVAGASPRGSQRP